MGNKLLREALEDLQQSIPPVIGAIPTYEEEISVAEKAASQCEIETLAISLMNVGWWSQEITGRLNAAQRQQKISEQQRYRIGNKIVLLESRLINALAESLRNNCSCKFR